ncbi:MAG TPA: hypothetical protein VE973_03495 [Candidatus Limnocylindria bacterium]|nr:hypothetical protein [Candidatus Limnocylindria bacterium]
MEETTATPEARKVNLPPAGIHWSFPDFIRENVNFETNNTYEAKWLSRAGLSNGYPTATLANVYTLLTRLRKKRENDLAPKLAETEVIDSFVLLVEKVQEALPSFFLAIKKERAVYQKRIDDLEKIVKITMKQFIPEDK